LGSPKSETSRLQRSLIVLVPNPNMPGLTLSHVLSVGRGGVVSIRSRISSSS